MTAKEYLKQYENIKIRMDTLERRIAELEERIDSGKSVTDYDGMPHGSNIGHPTEQRAIDLADEKRELEALQNIADEKSREIVRTILKVDGVAQKVLYSRYISLHSWEYICVEVNLSWTQTHFYHNQGLIKIAELLKSV